MITSNRTFTQSFSSFLVSILISFLFVNIINSKQRTGECRYFAETDQQAFVNLALWGYIHPTSFLVAVLLVVGLTFDHPIPGLEGLLAAGEVLLRHDRRLILGDAHQISLAGLDRSGYCGEACANCELLAGRLRTALYFLAEVESVAVRVLGCCYAVGTQQHFRT